MSCFRAFPLAEMGFVPVDPDRNPVRWYVADEDTEPWKMLGPYAGMAEADRAAERLNR